MNHKTIIQATENTEGTEMKLVPHTFYIHSKGGVKIYDNNFVFSVNSVFSVANCFF
jgi:hypothetical protein